jgi:gamma-carbonic anhydrase
MIGKFLNTTPKIAKEGFIACNAQLIGAVEIGEYSSIWYNVIARADINRIKIGKYTNVQDGSILHVDNTLSVTIGNYVTMGHGVIIHGCNIGDGTLIAMGAIILNAANIGKTSIVAAGSVVTKNFKACDGSLIMGSPAKVIRKLTKAEKEKNIYWAKKYCELAKEYKKRKML